MKRTVIVAILFGFAGATPHAAMSTLSDLCCACLPVQAPGAVQSGVPMTETRVAEFCAETPLNDEHDHLVERCVALNPNNKLLCIANKPGPSCPAQLAEETNIICPLVGAPVASSPALAVLVAAMSALGAWALRRRRYR